MSSVQSDRNDRVIGEAQLPRRGTDFAPWFHLLSAPAGYAEEAAVHRRPMPESAAVQKVLELGSGGGNNASHLDLLIVFVGVVDRA